MNNLNLFQTQPLSSKHAVKISALKTNVTVPIRPVLQNDSMSAKNKVNKLDIKG